MIPAIAYLRASTDDQKLGPEAQRAAITSYALANGFHVLSFHVDQGISGASPIDARPALLAALTAVRTHKAKALIVAKRDRLARDVLIAATIERSLPKGATIVSADGTGNGDQPADQLMRTILDGMSEYERALIRGRTKQALQAKKAKGERTGSIPYGYQLAPDAITLLPNEVEQATIQLAQDLRSLGLSHWKIVHSLKARGIQGRTGNPLGLIQVQRLLQRKVHAA